MKKSIITDYMEISAFSGKPAESTHHCVFGSGLRRLADQDRLIIGLTHDEHNMGELIERIHGNPAAEKLSKMVGQLAWERHWIAERLKQLHPGAGDIESEAREAFRKRYSISYL